METKLAENRRLLRRPDLLENKLQETQKMIKRTYWIVGFMFLNLVFSLWIGGGDRVGILLSVSLLGILIMLQSFMSERERLLLMLAMQEEGSSQEKGEREKLTVEKSCVADSEEAKAQTGEDVVLPDLGTGEKTYKLVRWTVNDGDEVKIGQNIAFIETDKATLDLESFANGTLRILQEEGTEAAFGTVIGRIE
ncbi:lipoyl domain-containing protein [Rubritalea squalenifaciens]|nr:lipoyl domain-containing protein [Rubritalea squalenifaciens]